jgi:hypothetical protein
MDGPTGAMTVAQMRVRTMAAATVRLMAVRKIRIIFSLFCVLSTCPACLVAPAGSYQSPASLSPTEKRFGVGGAAGVGVSGLSESGSLGGEGSVFFDFGITHYLDFRMQLAGQAWFTMKDVPWALGGTTEAKITNRAGDKALLVSISIMGFSDYIVMTPGVGGTFELMETSNYRIIGTTRVAYGLLLWTLQIGFYLGIDIPAGNHALRPEAGAICYFITDKSEVGDCTFGLGAAFLF